MAREELDKAAEALWQAVNAATGELRDKLEAQAEQVATLADRERGPDHGRLDRHQHALKRIREDAGEEVDGYVQRANELLEKYRETVEGV